MEGDPVAVIIVYPLCGSDRRRATSLPSSLTHLSFRGYVYDRDGSRVELVHDLADDHTVCDPLPKIVRKAYP